LWASGSSVSDFIADSSLLQWKDYVPLALVGTFVAYVVGVAVTLDPTRGVTGWLMRKCDARRDSAKVFAASSSRRLQNVKELLAGEGQASKMKFDADSAAAHYNEYGTLKLRLRPHREEVFFDCDKLDAEASVRLSSAIPLVVVSAVAWAWLDEWLFVIGIALAIILLLRGIGRAMEARDMARDAVLAGLVSHPLEHVIVNFGLKDGRRAPDSGQKEVGVS
jgi:hypothetical protein